MPALELSSFKNGYLIASWCVQQNRAIFRQNSCFPCHLTRLPLLFIRKFSRSTNPSCLHLETLIPEHITRFIKNCIVFYSFLFPSFDCLFRPDFLPSKYSRSSSSFTEIASWFGSKIFTKRIAYRNKEILRTPQKKNEFSVN